MEMKYETMQNLVDVYNAIQTLKVNGYLADEEYFKHLETYANTCAGRMAILCNRKKAADQTVDALQQKQQISIPGQEQS